MCVWYLDVMIFGASDYLVFSQQRLSHCQTHDGANVACQLSHCLQPTHTHTHEQTHTHTHTHTDTHRQTHPKDQKQKSVKFVAYEIFKVPVSLNEITFHLASEAKLLRHSDATGRDDTEEIFNTFFFHFWGRWLLCIIKWV